jgi:hypothetical protein
VSSVAASPSQLPENEKRCLFVLSFMESKKTAQGKSTRILQIPYKRKVAFFTESMRELKWVFMPLVKIFICGPENKAHPSYSFHRQERVL